MANLDLFLPADLACRPVEGGLDGTLELGKGYDRVREDGHLIYQPAALIQ